MTVTAEPQYMEALRLANEVRIRMGELKRDLKAGRKTLAEVVEDPAAGGMKALDLLMALPRRGSWYARRVLRAERISEYRRVKDLTERQRGRLVEVVDG